MTPFDLTLLLLLSNSVQNAMTGPDTSLVGGIVAAVTLLLITYVFADVSGMNRKFRRWIQGQPSLLVHNGEVISAHMAREHGIGSLQDVALAVLEVDGSISLLKYDDVPNHVHPQHRMKFLKHPN